MEKAKEIIDKDDLKNTVAYQKNYYIIEDLYNNTK
jgi:hypothetical protein